MPVAIIGAVVIFFGAFFTGFLGIEIVDTGHRGVKTIYGKVQPESLEEGLYFYNPLTAAFPRMDVRVPKYEIDTEASRATSSRRTAHHRQLQSGESKAHEMFANVGSDWEARLSRRPSTAR